MPRVILANDWRTPVGRYNRSVNGVPVEIPQGVLNRYKLPSTAEVVGPDYKTPAETAEEERYGDRGGELSSAEIEAEINRRVNERLDQMAEANEEEVEEEQPELLDVLDNSVADIVAGLKDYGLEELKQLLAAEKAGKTRVTLVAELEAAIEDAEAE